MVSPLLGRFLVSFNLQSAICGLQSAVCGLRSAVCGLQSAVCSLRSAVCSLQSAVCSLQSANVIHRLSINPKATLLLNDTIFSLQVRLVESFFVSKYFRQRFLHETPTQLTAHPKNVTFSKTKHEFPHDKWPVCFNDNAKNHLYYRTLASLLAGYLLAWARLSDSIVRTY